VRVFKRMECDTAGDKRVFRLRRVPFVQ
jgi:hypothetical protein